MRSLFGIGFNLVFVPYRIARKLGQDIAPCTKKMPDKAEISEVPSQKLLGVTFARRGMLPHKIFEILGAQKCNFLAFSARHFR